jgi:RDD family protein/uncharacterized protein DUF4339
MTEANWFYAADGESHGPLLEADLQQKFANGTLGFSTLVWTDGMAQWQPADSVPAFSSISPEPIVEVEAEEVDDGVYGKRPRLHETPRQTLLPSPPEPWRRYLARQLDTIIFTFLCLNIFGPIEVSSTFGGSLYMVSILMGWALVEGVLISRIGTTFGKWLLQIEVTDAYGQRLGLKQSLRRSFDVLLRGMGFGLTYIIVFAQLLSLHQLTTTGQTLWDRDGHSVVRHPTPLDPIRWVGLIALLILLYKASAASLPLVA